MAAGKIKLDVDADITRMKRQIDKAAGQIELLKRKLKETGSTSRKSAKDQEDAWKKANKDSFGPQVISQVKSFATSFVGVGTAVAAVTKAFAKLREERNRAAREVEKAEFPLTALAQLAEGRPEELARMIKEAKESRLAGAPSLEEAARLQFMLESTGRGEHREMLAQFYGIAEPTGLLRAGAATQAAFGREETGALPEVLAKLLKGSGKAMASLEEFAPAVSSAAAAMKTIGTTDEEALAAIAAISDATDGAANAAVQLSRLADVIAKKGFGGQGLVEGFGRLREEAAELTTEEFLKYIPEVRARRGYEAVGGALPKIQEIRGGLEALGAPGAAEEYLEAVATSPEAIPRLAARRLHRRAEAKYELAQEQRGLMQTLREAAVLETAAETERHPTSLRWWERGMSGLGKALGLDPILLTPEPITPTGGPSDVEQSILRLTDAIGRNVQVIERHQSPTLQRKNLADPGDPE